MKQFKFLILVIFLAISSVNGQVKNNTPENFTNPILSGFYSDPSICRNGDDYYLVNSSFEMYPGIPIHHSKDLVNWELINYGVSNPETFIIGEGRARSNDIFAPSIRYHDGLFYIICTGVGGQGNFFVTAKDPAKEWSAPVWIEGSEGIDPEIFWDDDGRSYYVGQSSPRHYNINGKLKFEKLQWDGQSIVYMQEIDLKNGKLIGKKEILTHGHATNARWTEGPHLFKRNGKYLLMAAEGGTDFYHATVFFHSDSLWGPYIPEHTNPVFTHRNLGADYPVWAVGHADMVQTQKGDWWSVMHAKRKVDEMSILARETFLTPVTFDKNTPVFNPGIGKLSAIQKRPDLPWTPVKPLPNRDDFKDAELALYWNFIRTPIKKWYSIKNGKLILETRQKSIDNFENPSFIGRRVVDHNCSATTALLFKTKKENEKAGLVLYRNKDSHFQLVKSAKTIQLINTSVNEKKIVSEIPYSKDEVFLKIANNSSNKAVFSFSENGEDFQQIGEAQDLFYLSDEAFVRYNGLYVGMYTTSLDKESNNQAKFDWFELKSTNNNE